ncbi:MAG: hypothetical protein IKW83_12080 [Muribaculaceae bacterium]|nr:hypothetical protein [Muribaculaceae bacterium]
MKQTITSQMLTDRNEYLLFISNITGIASDVIMSTSRVDTVCCARYLLSWALVELCGYSTTTVGKLMRRNHATVWHGYNIIKFELIQPFDDIRQKIDAIKQYHLKRMEAVTS